MKIFESIKEATKVNRRTKKVDLITVEEEKEFGKIEVYASHVLSPTVLISGRYFVDAKYLF